MPSGRGAGAARALRGVGAVLSWLLSAPSGGPRRAFGGCIPRAVGGGCWCRSGPLVASGSAVERGEAGSSWTAPVPLGSVVGSGRAMGGGCPGGPFSDPGGEGQRLVPMPVGPLTVFTRRRPRGVELLGNRGRSQCCLMAAEHSKHFAVSALSVPGPDLSPLGCCVLLPTAQLLPAVGLAPGQGWAGGAAPRPGGTVSQNTEGTRMGGSLP